MGANKHHTLRLHLRYTREREALHFLLPFLFPILYEITPMP